MTLSLIVVLPLIAVFLPFVLGARRAAWMAVVPALLFAGLCLHAPSVLSGQPVASTLPWIPSLGIGFALRLDGLSLLLALLITGIGTFIYLYASAYLAGHANLPRFMAILSVFTAAMLGSVLADDLVALLVFWEMTSLASFMLIGFEPEAARARRSAQQGLLITVGGGLCLLAGAILLGTAAGTFRISEILGQAPALAAHPHAPAIVALIALGAFAKSAQAPLHAWLTNAMVAPTPVSAFLHSATMVKLGVYLLARFNPAFGDLPLWNILLLGGGTITMITATVLALRETDLKRVLAYSTIVSLGTLVSLIALPQPVAATAMASFLLVHALYKACLFMVAGIVDHETGTRDASCLGGLARAMPLTASAAVLGALSMAGLPPFAGFLGKELIYEAGLSSGWPWVQAAVGVAANACMVVVAGIVAMKCFFGRPDPGAQMPVERPHDPGMRMLAGPLALGMLGLALGLVPALASPLIAAAASAVQGTPLQAELALWHGMTPMLALSALTLILGFVVLASWKRLRTWLASRRTIETWGPDRCYDHIMEALQGVAAWQTRHIQRGSLRGYLCATFMVATIAILATLALRGGFAWPGGTGDVLAPVHVLAALLVAATAAVVLAGSFMKGIAAAGMVGFVVALVFLFRGAPDLAFTQFSIEALSIVILLAIVGRMPFREADTRRPAEKRRDALVAIAFGTSLALMLAAIVAGPFDPRLSDYFRAESLPQAHGRNLVNVIIVDFRAIDTLGEITVLALAALAAAAAIAGVAQRQPGEQGGQAGVAPSEDSLILRMGARLILPACLAFSLYLLWRGHNYPGGGFVGGLVAAAGFAVHALSRGKAAMLARLKALPKGYAGAGLVLAAASGVPGLMAGQPFLTHQWMVFDNGFAIGTALLFDIGVYLSVLGAVLTFLVFYLDKRGN